MSPRAKRLYRFGLHRLDATDRLLYKDEELVPLPPKVLDTLLLLVSSGGHVLSREEMVRQLWPDTFVEEGTLTQYVSVLRKALGEDGKWIENLPRRGYRFTAQVEDAGAAVVDQAAMDQAPRSRPRAVAAGLAILLALTAAAGVWLNRRQELPKFDSVAVLPFRTLSDSGNDYLADGITEALITRLTNLKGLRVVSHSRVRRFKGSSEEAAAIGRQLGVEAVIEGTVRVASGRLRISVQGVDTKSGYTIWAIDRFEATPERLLDLEGQLAEAAAQRVKGQLTAKERLLVTKSNANNAEAYDLVLRARGADTVAVMEMLQRAVQLDSSFADAYGWLALAQIRAYWASRGGRELVRNAISNVNRALSIDPNSSVAIRALVHIQHETGRPVEALLMARRALENAPDDLDAIAAAAEAYFRTGLYDRAIPLYEKALAGEPGNLEFRTQLARMYLFLGQHKTGVEIISSVPLKAACCFGMLLYFETGQMDKAVEVARGDPDRPPLGFPAYVRGFVLDAAGDHAGAKAMWANAVGTRRAQIQDAMIYAKLGRRAEALQTLRESLEPDPQHPVSLFFAAQTRALLGQRREALDTLKAAVENGFSNLPMIEYHTREGLSFHILRDDPEFHALRADLVRRIDDLRSRY